VLKYCEFGADFELCGSDVHCPARISNDSAWNPAKGKALAALKILPTEAKDKRKAVYQGLCLRVVQLTLDPSLSGNSGGSAVSGTGTT
jgi:hypothetical protein